MAKANAAATLNDLDAIIGGGDDPVDELDAAIDGMQVGADQEEIKIDLDAIDLDGIVEYDYRPMEDGAWYDAEIVKAVSARSKAAKNLQIEFTLRVITPGEFVGVTVQDEALVDPKVPKAHFKIKKYFRYTGLSKEEKDPATGKTVTTRLTKDIQAFVGRRIKFQNRVDRDYDPQNPRNKCQNWGFPTDPNPPFSG